MEDIRHKVYILKNGVGSRGIGRSYSVYMGKTFYPQPLNPLKPKPRLGSGWCRMKFQHIGFRFYGLGFRVWR